MNNIPVWQLPVNENSSANSYISSNVKYHCFVNKHSLCGKYTQDTDYYETGIESGEIASNPQFACKVCRNKWLKKFYILS